MNGVVGNANFFLNIKSPLLSCAKHLLLFQVQSSCDGELLFQIPFTNCVRLKALTVRAPSNGSGPSKMKIWVNRDDVDFSTCHDLKCSQELIVPQDALGEFKIVLKPALFQNTNTIAILFYAPYNDDDEITMSFLGFFGQPTTHKRQAVNVVYEAKANPKDHKTDASADVNPSTIN